MKLNIAIKASCISILFFLYASSFLFSQADSLKKGELVWHSDLLEAQDLSKSLNKPIFAFFTGSDWCGWCHKLQRDVLEKSEFKKWAQKNVVLLELDFPRNKQLSPELSQQNADLQQAFQVQGFPTIWMFYLSKDEASGKFKISPLGSLGYPQGVQPGKEAEKFISNANSILTKKLK